MKDIALDGQLIESNPMRGQWRLTTMNLRTPQGLSRGCRYADGVVLKRMIVSVKSSDQNGDGKADDITGMA